MNSLNQPQAPLSNPRPTLLAAQALPVLLFTALVFVGLVFTAPGLSHASCAGPAAQVLWHWPTSGATVPSGGIAMMSTPLGTKASARIGTQLLKVIPSDLDRLHRFRLPDLPAGATVTVVYHVEQKYNGPGLKQIDVEVDLVIGAKTSAPSKQLAAPSVQSCEVPSLNTIKQESCLQDLLRQACLDQGFVRWHRWQATPPPGAVAWFISQSPAPGSFERRFILPLSCDPAFAAGGGPGSPTGPACYYLHALDQNGDWGVAHEACVTPLPCMIWDSCRAGGADAGADAGADVANVSLSCDASAASGDAGVGPDAPQAAAPQGDTLDAVATDTAAAPAPRSPADDGCAAAPFRGPGAPIAPLLLLTCCFAVLRRHRQRSR